MANFSDIVSPLLVNTISLTSSNITLTSSQYSVGTIIFSGTLTANVTVTFPNIVKYWTIFNRTSGAFTVTLAMSGGSTSTTILQGFAKNVFSDGTSGMFTSNSDVSGASSQSLNISGGGAYGLDMGNAATFTSGAIRLGYGSTQGVVSSTGSTTPVTVLYTDSGNKTYLGNSGGLIANGSFTPSTDNALSFGSSSLRWVNVYSYAVNTQAITGTSLILNEAASGMGTLTVNAPSDANGANIKLIGNGSTTPNKTLRANSGSFQVVNNAYSAVIFQLSDVGNLSTPGGIDSTAIGASTPSTGAFTNLSASGQITSTVANGTAPFVVTSSTNVPNLNASSLNGATFANPGSIGSTTPVSTFAASTIRYTSQVVTTSTTLTSSSPYRTIVNSSSAVTITLPASPLSDQTLVVKNIGTGTVTLTATAGIDANTTVSLSQWSSACVAYNSTLTKWTVE